MSGEQFTKTVRIDLMPDNIIGSGTVKSSEDRIAGANWSSRRRQTAAAATATISKYNGLLQSVYDAAFITSPSGRILDVNDRAYEFLRYDSPRLCDLNFFNLLDGADESLMNSIIKTLEKECFALLKAFCRRCDGSLFPAEIAVSHLNGDKARLCFFVRDITIRHQAEEMLRTEHTAVQTCGSGIAIADVDGLLTYVNPAFTRMLGSNQEDILDENIHSVFGNSEVLSTLIKNALSDNQTWLGDLEIINIDGDPLYLQISAACSRGADGDARGIVFSFADITQHKETERALKEAKAALEGSGDE